MVELAEVVERAVEISRPLIEARRHELVESLPSQPVWLEADPVRLAQVLANLLNNAAKYTEERGRIELCAVQEGAELTLFVRDNGTGIAPEVLPRVFDLFAQDERTLDRAQGGLGIGLTLVKKLVELHGGLVTAHSEGPGRGSEFVVRLPAAMRQTPATAAVAAPVAEASPSGCRVLVVDDNADAAESLALLLRIQGHDVRTASDGPAALEAAEIFRPEVVLLDLGLPKMSGYEVARLLRQQPESEGIRLLALTGYGQEDDHRRSREAGFDAHLVKPVDLEELMRMVARASIVERERVPWQ
jgi:CheY-like chemotaxis protein